MERKDLFVTKHHFCLMTFFLYDPQSGGRYHCRGVLLADGFQFSA